jgi:adenylate cyclase
VNDAEAPAGGLEQTLLGGPRRYNRVQVAGASGVPLERARTLWRAMGFPDVGDDEAIFTDADVTALRLVGELEDAGRVQGAAVVGMARSMARSLARLADWQVGELQGVLGAPAGSITEAQAVQASAEVVPVLEQVMVYMWRRQLAAAAGRVLTVSPEQSTGGRVVVGFADLVSYTALTRRLDEPALAELIDRFESLALDVVSAGGGRVVKTVGDEVLFVADEAVAAAETALRLVERIEADDLLPSVRAGLAYGPVLSRLGDVYGPVVNLASRLTALARPDTVLIDMELAGALAGARHFELRRLRRRAVAGYGHLAPTLLRRSDGAGGPRITCTA